MITQAYLKKKFQYDPDTGLFWKYKPGRHAVVVGTPRNGYIRIMVKRKLYFAHRLAWLYVTGEWPKEYIDHKDMDGTNNVFSNLREADGTDNNANKRVQKNNTSGYRGVFWIPTENRWCMQVRSRGKTATKRYITKEAAADAYAIYAVLHFGEFAPQQGLR